MKRISVVIVTYNSSFHIYDCLKSLFDNNDIGEDLEVIIVDNCSADFNEMKKKVHDIYGESVVIIANNRNGGYGQGNNVGIRNAMAPIIMIMNPDVRLVEPVFQKVCESFGENVVMIGMRQLNKDSKPFLSFDSTSLISPFVGIPLSKLCNRFNIYISKIMYFAGACFFVKKKAFEEVGLFDEDIFMYSEEDDIHQRLQRIKGSQFIYLSDKQYVHLHGIEKKIKKEENEYKPYLQRFKSQAIWKQKIGISNEKSLAFSNSWVQFFVLYHGILAPLSRKSNKQYLFYCGLKKELQNLH